MVNVAEKATVPVNPLLGVTLMVTEGAELAAATATVALLPETVTPVPLGVSAKSAQEPLLATWTVTGSFSSEPFAAYDEPSAGICAPPIEP